MEEGRDCSVTAARGFADYWQLPVFWLQTLPVRHTSLLQQRWPRSPHAAQTLLRQSVYGAVQSTLLPQHAWPAFPHVPPWQPPPVQVPWPPGQVEPSPMQILLFCSQHPPFTHTLPAQQGWPGPPHWAQTPWLQPSEPSLQVSFAQHGWPAPPHAAQVLPPVQPRSALAQLCPAQHGWPAPPQVTQVLALQACPDAVHRPPQQG